MHLYRYPHYTTAGINPVTLFPCRFLPVNHSPAVSASGPRNVECPLLRFHERANGLCAGTNRQSHGEPERLEGLEPPERSGGSHIAPLGLLWPSGYPVGSTPQMRPSSAKFRPSPCASRGYDFHVQSAGTKRALPGESLQRHRRDPSAGKGTKHGKNVGASRPGIVKADCVLGEDAVHSLNSQFREQNAAIRDSTGLRIGVGTAPCPLSAQPALSIARIERAFDRWPRQ